MYLTYIFKTVVNDCASIVGLVITVVDCLINDSIVLDVIIVMWMCYCCYMMITVFMMIYIC